MILSHSKKFIFIHIPRTGGTAISRALGNYHYKRPTKSGRYIKYKPLHVNCSYSKITNFINSYFIFTFIRNPWIQALSYYLYDKKKYPFENFIKDKKFHKFDEYTNCANYVGLYENLQNDLDKICKHLDIFPKPLKNTDNSSNNMIEDFEKKMDYYYTAELAEIIYEVNQESIEKYGYKYPNIIY